MKASNPGQGDVSFVDTSLAVGQHTLWCRGLTDDDALTLLAQLNGGRFDRVEIPSPALRLSREPSVEVADLTTWDRRAAGVCPQTPLRWVGPLDLPLADGGRSSELGRLLLQRAASAGVREVRLGAAANSVELARSARQLAGEVGVGFVAEVAFTTSPVHDDAGFVALAQQLAELEPARICFTDRSGLLTPERVAELVPQMLEAAPSNIWEFLGHCNNWLGPLNALAAAEAGISVLHTAIPPLASAESAPPLDVVVDNLRARERSVRSQPDALGGASALLSFLARRSGAPIPNPREFDHGRLRHHLSEPQLTRLRARLDRDEALGSSASVLAEVEAVRGDLGYPVMAGEVGDVVVDQAVLNVTARSRYEDLAPGLARIVAARPGDASPVAPELEKRLQDGDAAAGSTPDVPLAEVRRRLGSLSESALIEQAVLGASVTDAERDQRLRAPVPSGSPVVRLVRALTSEAVEGSLSVEKPGFALRLEKGPASSRGAEGRTSAPPTRVHRLPTPG